ncbi:MaoC/PaaZ C-terminal domain-containing protein [Lipingzhangella sp. LS1_29]|uniref:MaoC/PaaZ C-terminal domain-containing protein n=1 Tax=Lipingzhangella rawalii TaxID=2055835 RepID=A0ABU2H3U8_9ACTN|nr:MaoC/PaaZ C-terminal domain-containing protein [Lipingzhangella rawalii]MDS1269977.1 MaoC/PaaZ C-terminal domain-containing protein [Lipingzhangella rawalii]
MTPITQQPRYDEIAIGTELPEHTFTVRRGDLVRYAGASGDFNEIHWSERVATAVGLPNVIAHGMLTMAQAGRVVTDWIGDPGGLLEYGVRFSSPVVVPDDDQGAEVRVGGRVTEKRDNNEVVVAITANSGEAKVLTRATAVVRLP